MPFDPLPPRAISDATVYVWGEVMPFAGPPNANAPGEKPLTPIVGTVGVFIAGSEKSASFTDSVPPASSFAYCALTDAATSSPHVSINLFRFCSATIALETLTGFLLPFITSMASFSAK